MIFGKLANNQRSPSFSHLGSVILRSSHAKTRHKSAKIFVDLKIWCGLPVPFGSQTFEIQETAIFLRTSIVHFQMLFCFFRIMLSNGFCIPYSRPNSKFTRSSALSLIYLLEFLYSQEFPRFSHICIH